VSQPARIADFAAAYRERREAKTGMKDWRGVPVLVGSHVIKPSHAGSTSWIQEYEVLVIEEGIFGGAAMRRLRCRPVQAKGRACSYKDVWLTALSTVTVVPA